MQHTIDLIRRIYPDALPPGEPHLVTACILAALEQRFPWLATAPEPTRREVGLDVLDAVKALQAYEASLWRN